MNQKKFREYVEWHKNNPINSFSDAYDIIDQNSTKHLKTLNLGDYRGSQETIPDEIRAWKKFYLNNYKKSNIREFQPFLTNGEISKFIENQLQGFVDRERFPTIEELLDKLVNKHTRNVTGLPNYSAFTETTKLIQGAINRIDDTPQRQALLDKLKLFTQDGSNKINARLVYERIESFVGDIFSELLYKNNSNKNKLIGYIFDVVTDNNLDNINKFSAITNRLRSSWSNFVINNLETKKGVKPTDVFNVVLDVFDNLKKDIVSTKNIFKFNFQRSLYKAINKQIPFSQFNKEVRKIINYTTKRAFRNGLEFFGLDPRDFQQVERLIVNRLSFMTTREIAKFTNAVYNRTMSSVEALIKSQTWYNKTIDKFFELGKLVADKGGLYQWVLGATEQHCPTCSAANGQIHKLETWHKYNIIPKSSRLICKGFHCDCQLLKVTGKATGSMSAIPIG